MSVVRLKVMDTLYKQSKGCISPQAVLCNAKATFHFWRETPAPAHRVKGKCLFLL